MYGGDCPYAHLPDPRLGFLGQALGISGNAVCLTTFLLRNIQGWAVHCPPLKIELFGRQTYESRNWV
jgi:hypothetical protein